MNTNTILLFGAMFIVLIIGYSESASADHLKEEADSIFRALDEGNIAVSVEDSKYRLHLQTVYRNGDGHLLYVNESTSSAFLPHEITDSVFDTMLGEKEIVTINNTKYEKVQFTFSPGLEQRYMAVYPIFSEFKIEVDFSDEVITKMHEEDLVRTNWRLHYCANFGEVHGSTCVSMFICNIPTVTLQPSDTTTQQWTILRMMN